MTIQRRRPVALAENIVHFVRVLRAAGLPVGPAHTLAAQEAAVAVGVADREDFRAALASVLVSRHEHLPIFEPAFDLFWQDPRLLHRLLAAPCTRGSHGGRTRPGTGDRGADRAGDAADPVAARAQRRSAPGPSMEPAFTSSPRELLRHKDFETMTVAELAAAKAMLREMRLPLPELPIRRTVAAVRGHRIDLRATLRRATGAAGTLSPLRWRRRAAAHAAARHPLRHLGLDGPLRADAAALPPRDHRAITIASMRCCSAPGSPTSRATSGIATSTSRWRACGPPCRTGPAARGSARCLVEFNRRWSRRLLGQNAVVLLITDGLDAEAGEGLGAQMERLRKSCRRLVWLNPLLRYEGFEARPAGIRAMLPHVDDFLPVHNLESLAQLARVLGGPVTRGRTALQRDGAG